MPPDHRRRARAARLRAQGLTFAEIGRRMGVTHQAARSLVNGHRTGRHDGRPPVLCRECQTELNPAASMKRDHLTALCPDCASDASFAERLMAHRLAAGLVVK